MQQMCGKKRNYAANMGQKTEIMRQMCGIFFSLSIAFFDCVTIVQLISSYKVDSLIS